MKSVGLYDYHRGVEWLWLNQFMVEGELECGDAESAYELYLSGQVESALHKTAVGGLSELYDINGPLGADFQAWSMAGFVASLHAFSGMDIDAHARRLRIRPDPPGHWPRYSCRRQMGSARFDLLFERGPAGTQSVRITPIDAIPSGTTLSIGARMKHEGHARVRVNGEDARHTRVPICNPDLDEVWTDVEFTGEVCAEFDGTDKR
jgi:hypothetical protein